jgi:hypothetical protein
MAELQGAFASLPISHGIAAVRLANHPAWVQALRAAAGRARSERPRVPVAATAADITNAMRNAGSDDLRRLLALSWLCAGRTGDIRQLRATDVSREGNVLTITFRRGKTVSRRGPYTVHTVIPVEWLQHFPAGVDWADHLHTASVAASLTCLRAVDKKLENRSIRRGSLQVLASDSALSESDLLLFSGHTTLATLRRYLGWGSIGSHKRALMTTAARYLDPVRGGSEPAAVPASAFPAPPPYFPPATDASRYSCARIPPESHRTKFTRSMPQRTERWLQFLGTEAPPSSSLPGKSPSQDALANMPLASKDVAGTVDVKATIALAHNAELRTYTQDVTEWLRQPALYRQLFGTSIDRRARTKARSTLPDSDAEIQHALRKYDLQDRAREILAWCRVFSVPQPAKGTRRHICEPLINDHFSTTPTVRFRNAAARAQIISRHSWAAQLDFASWFDQIPLEEAVRPFFGIRQRSRLFRMAVLPMGFRPSAAIGQALTWCITDVDPSALGAGCTIITYIDNILILGPSPEAVKKLTELIIQRAVSVGAQFSEGLTKMTADARFAAEAGKPEHQPTQSFDFLGMRYDLRDKTVRQSRKTADKVRAVLNYLTSTATDAIPDTIQCTARELAAVFGLALFASSSCATRTRISTFRPAFQFFRRMASAQASGGNWSRAISLSGPALASFRAWFAELGSNSPTRIAPAESPPHPDVLFVDASADGWGAVHLRGGSANVIAGSWSAADHAAHDLSSSVSAEPLAITRALARCVAPLSAASVIVYTDHMPIVAACSSPCAKGYAYWRLQQFLLQFPIPVEIRWIPGSKNPADASSRGDSSCGEAWANIYATALNHHSSMAAAKIRATEDGDYGEAGERHEWWCTARNPVRVLNNCDGRLVQR